MIISRSFGILLCEIFNKGLSPYLGLSNYQVADFIINHKLHDIPKNCPLEM